MRERERRVIYYHRMYGRVRVIVKRKSKEKREKAKETCIAAKYFTTGTEEYNKQKERKTTTNTNTKMYAKARAVRRNARLPDVVKR